MQAIKLKSAIFFPLLLSVLITSCSISSKSLFDGATLAGWEGDTLTTWRVENGAIVGGSLEETVPHNEFLCTRLSYADFDLRLKYKLESNGGFINAGVQFRSQRATDPAFEMIGYQADIGPGYFGVLYDETRRNKVLAGIDLLACDFSNRINGTTTK